jgi:adenosylhomocysteine nucleosidase
MTMLIHKLGLMSAMPQEQANLRSVLSEVKHTRMAQREFTEGVFHGEARQLSLVCALSGIGKVAAATTASLLITHYGCDALLFTGVAGGIGEGVRVGDMVLGTHCLQHDMDASPLFPRYELPMRGVSALPTHAALTQVLRGVLEALCEQGSISVHEGLIVSGDKFVSAAADAQRLKRDLRAAGYEPLCVEMEGAAVAQVCADVEVPFALARIISDRADDTAHADFMAFLTTRAAPLSEQITRSVLGLLTQT